MKLSPCKTTLIKVLPSDVDNGRVFVPDSVKSIGNWAFSFCDKELTTLTLSDGVKTIGKSALYGCKKLRNLTLPDSVESIDDFIFSGCKELTTLIIDSPKIEAGEKVRALLPEHLQKIAVIKNVSLAKAMQAITPLIHGCINGSFPLSKDIVGVIFQHLLPPNSPNENKKNVERVFNVVNNIFKVKKSSLKHTEILGQELKIVL